MWTSHEQDKIKSWTSHEELINKLWSRYEQVMKKSWTSRDQVMYKKWTRLGQVIKKSWRCQEGLINKLWTRYEQTPWSLVIKSTKITEPLHVTSCPGVGGCTYFTSLYRIKSIYTLQNWASRCNFDTNIFFYFTIG